MTFLVAVQALSTLTARCPNGCKEEQFYTTAHVMQDWRVDKRGNFIECVGELETTYPPNPRNHWTCVGCGENAILEYEENANQV